LLPGQVAFFFAAIASLLMLTEASFALLEGFSASNSFFLAGIHSISFFAAAAVAQILSKRISKSEALAKQRGIDLRHLESINADIIQRFHAGIIVADSHGHISLINDVARQLCLLPAEGSINSLHEVSNAFLHHFKQWQAGVLQQSRPLTIHLLNTEVMISFSHFGGSAGNANTLIIVEDAARIAQQTQQLKLVSLGRLTASIAHELRNPLAAVSHAAQLLEETNLSAKQDKRLLDIICQQTERMNAVINDIFQLSRKYNNHPESIQLKSWLMGFSQEFSEFSPDKVAITVDVAADDLRVVSDKSQLHQLMMNLCENSYLHGKTDQGQANILLSAARDDNTGMSYLDVIDYGAGIELESIEQIFEPFYTTTRFGTGLGLYIAKELCEANQACLNYIPRGTGSCFRITFQQMEQ